MFLAKELKIGKLTILLWVYIGITNSQSGISAYTLGSIISMKKEVEILKLIQRM